LLNGYGLSVWRVEKVLETGVMVAKQLMYLMPWKCTLKMVKMANFILYIFYHNKQDC